MLITLSDVSKSFGSELIFERVTAKVEDRDRIGLVGANGTGKTTLLNIIAGATDCDKGEIARGSACSVGYQRQNSGLCQSETIIGEMQSVFADVYAIERELDRLRREMATASADEQELLAQQYHKQEDRLIARDGYSIDVRISTVLTGMGFAEHGRDKRIEQLSGGEQTRLAIAKLLLEEPSLLILDEPTNHLDFKTLGWLEDYLSGYHGAILIVSHDRYFIDKLCTTIWEMDRGELAVFGGNYTKYLQLREERNIRQQKLYEEQQEEIAKLEDYVARNLARASTTKMAQSRRRTLDKMERIERPKSRVKPPFIKLEYAAEPVKDVLAITGLAVAVGDSGSRKVLLDGLDLEVTRGDKIAIIGGNGAGKTSLLRAIMDGDTKERGRVDWGRGVKHSYYTQGSENLDVNLTALDTLWQYYPHSYETPLRNMLGALGLHGEDAFKLVGQLSGGERARLKLSVICLAGSNLLILDEPTNHLDLATKEVLEQALESFTGTILMVSHDRYLLDRLPTRIIELDSGRATVYKGCYSDYLQAVALTNAEERQAASQPDKQDSDSKQTYRRGKEARREEAARRKEYSEIGLLVATLEQELTDLAATLVLPETTADYLLLQELLGQQQDKQQRLDIAIERWLELSEE